MSTLRRHWKWIAAFVPLVVLLGIGLWGWLTITSGSSVMKAKFDRLSIGMSEHEGLSVLQDGRPARLTIRGGGPVEFDYADLSRVMHGGQITIRCINGRITKMDLRPPTNR